MKLLYTLPACNVIVELQFQVKIGANQTKSILVDYKAGPLNSSQSLHKTNQFSRLICEARWRYIPLLFSTAEVCKNNTDWLTGTTSHLLQTPLINYEFNNHLSTMLCVINRSPVSASCNLFSGQEVWTLHHYTADNVLLSPLSTPSLPSHLISDYRVTSPVVNSSQLSTYRIYLTATDGLSVNTNLRARIH